MNIDLRHTDRELVEAFIEKRLSDNLAVLKEKLPELYHIFKDYREERFFLIYDEAGNINIFDREMGKAIYQGNPVELCYKNLEDFLESPIQRPFVIAKPSEGKKDEVNYLHSSFLGELAKIQHDVLAKVFEGNLKKALDFDDGFSSSVMPNSINLLFVMSTGISLDIEKLYFDKTIRNLIVVEPCLDAFYISLQLMDWASVIEKSVSEGLDIHFVMGDEVVSGVSNVVSNIGRHNVSGAFLYSGFYIDEFKDLFKEIKDAIGYSYLSGFGFYDDSRYSLSHTLGNIKNNVPFFSTNRSIIKKLGQEDIPVFIVGNGPSLDESMDFIKSNSDKAIIFGCGSSLKPLMLHGIDPDFFVELERTALVTHFINSTAQYVDDFYERLKRIKFIGVSQVDPATFELFEKRGQVLKDTETGTMLAHKLMIDNNVPVLARLAPTCVHTAVTLATIMGFRNIHLFGVDMGTADLERHHSKHSLYAKASDKTNASLSINKDAEVYKSNFGDKDIYSSALYPMFKRELESILKGWKSNIGESLNYYNCSDGALIDGADPLEAKEIDLSSGFNKAEISEKVFSAYFSFYPESLYSEALIHLDEISEMIGGACDWAVDVINHVESRSEAHRQIDRFGLEFHSDAVFSDDNAWLYSIFDGSLLYAFSIMNSTIQLPANEDFVVDKVNKQFDELKVFFRELKDDFKDNCLKWDQEERHASYLGEDV